MSSAADYFAPGSYNDPSAPWNKAEIPKRVFGVMCSQSLSKNTHILTQDYEPEINKAEGCIEANTQNTDWKKAYQDVAMTPLDIINNAKEVAKELLVQGLTKVGNVYLKGFVRECEGWTEDELEVMEEW